MAGAHLVGAGDSCLPAGSFDALLENMQGYWVRFALHLVRKRPKGPVWRRRRIHLLCSTLQHTAGQTVESWIDPALERNIGRGKILRTSGFEPSSYCTQGSPFAAAEIKIVMPAVNVLCNEIADHAADQYVRWKMLARFHARDAHQRGQAVRHDLGERAGIFVSDYACHRPCSRGMFRRKIGRAHV